MSPPRDFPRKLDLRHGCIEMQHGGGGRAMAQLVEELFVAAFANPALSALNDQAVLDAGLSGRLVIATDSHVVSPLFFPGGDIGSLAVHGTVNDVAMAAAEPRWLAASFILEEGFPLAELARIVDSMAQAARAAGVAIVTGDTKVVEAGKGDGVFITTTGVGVARAGFETGGTRARPGDVVLVSGAIGDHGIAIMACREGLDFDVPIESDSAALHGLVAALCTVLPPPALRVLRDPTRGGLGATLNEIARASGVGLQLAETAIPVHEPVRAACEFLGLDPLYVANEGKLIAIVDPAHAETALAALREHPLGREAARIGVCTDDGQHFVELETGFGGRRVVDWIAGEQLPRIC